MAVLIFFMLYVLPILKFLFVQLEWLKNLKGPFEEDSAIMLHLKIGHMLSFLYI